MINNIYINIIIYIVNRLNLQYILRITHFVFLIVPYKMYNYAIIITTVRLI